MSEIEKYTGPYDLNVAIRAAEAKAREFWALYGVATLSLPKFSYIDGETGCPVWAFDNVVKAERGGYVYDSHGDPMTPFEARELAAALLAGALFAEGVRVNHA
ncbi:hypothetical protein [Mycobacteroides salmoniphilum]|uniref:hypothetical protein n=1 Tax=Mycobacteroides salmoniphilum TaxID=404941 RepID=UPI0009930D38|nr:hypothetical protein [Mycobacteroides salmoniphilum]